ncbi:RNA polymerase sigma factor [Ornithinibacillus californiensis]|uniref:RNA polymerase sigma factor n=1 Tax=Ornithinibacillus californiensis TaxID=161536 RepID=UPI00064DE638|nr:RNA polymerase sigma factor [Ornithinibacillus californiensis]
MEDYAKQQLEEWYHLYSVDVFRFIFILIGDREKAKDLTHDTFLKAFQSVHSFQHKTSDKNWLYKIARNTTIDEMKRKKPFYYAVENLFSLTDNRPNPEEMVALGEREEQLYLSLRKIKRPYQEVIVFRKIKQLSIKETAEILGWRENKVKVYLHRGLEDLKKQMVKEGYVHESN